VLPLQDGHSSSVAWLSLKVNALCGTCNKRPKVRAVSEHTRVKNVQPESSRWHISKNIARQIVQPEFRLVVDLPGDDPEVEEIGSFVQPDFPDIAFVADLSGDLLGDGAGIDLLMNDHARLLPTGANHHIRIPPRAGVASLYRR
jgi:hypothetical protein